MFDSLRDSAYFPYSIGSSPSDNSSLSDVSLWLVTDSDGRASDLRDLIDGVRETAELVRLTVSDNS